MDDDLAFAFELADLAATMSVPRFRSRAFEVREKPDGSPVTDVDVAVEDALRARIAERHPGHEIVGEERGSSGSSEWRWYLDPIDGTVRFVDGDPQWMTLIALAERGQVTLGVVDLPAVGERWWATRGGGAFRGEERIEVSTCDRLSEATVNDTWRQDLARGNTEHPLWDVAQQGARTRPNQDHGLLAVACGRADVAIGIGGFSWDYAPLKPILEEAGGAFTDLMGGDGVDSRAVVATNGLLHDEVLAVIARSSAAGS
jgi:histidinol-phosphatase